MAKTSILTILINLAKQGNADRETVKGLAQLKQAGTQLIGTFMGLVGAGIAVGRAFQATVGTFVDYAAQVRDLSRLSGATAEESSRLIQVADDLKISYESLQKSLWFASKNGVEVNIESLASLADEYTALANPTERAEFLAQKFGKSGAEMGKLLEQGADGVREMAEAIGEGQILTESAVATARLYEIQLDNINDRIESVKLALGQGLVGIVTGSTVAIQQQAQAIFEASNGFSFNTNMAGRYTDAQRAAWEEAVKLATEQWLLSQGLGATADAAADATSDLNELSMATDLVNQKNQDMLGLIMNLQTETQNYNLKSDELKLKLQELTTEQGKYIEGGRKYNEIQGEIDETKAAITALAEEHEMAGKRIAFSLLQQKLAVDGLSDAEFTALLATGEKWGLIDESVVKSAMIMDRETAKMAADLGKPDSQLMDIIDKLNNLESKSGSVFDFYVKIHTSGSGVLPGRSTCFIAGTPVRMADGTQKPIETIEPGDMVLAYDLERREFVARRVTARMVHQVINHLWINDLGVTGEHRFWVVNRSAWTAAQDLQLLDLLLSTSGKLVPVSRVDKETASVIVYNIEVEDVHNYFAGGVLVHNAKAVTEMAGGGQLDGRGWTLVGEEGFELISPTGRVFPHEESKELLVHGLSPEQGMMFGGDMQRESQAYLSNQGALYAGQLQRRKARRDYSPVASASAAGSSEPAAQIVEAVAAATEVSAQAAQTALSVQQAATREAVQTRAAIQQGNQDMLSELQAVNENLRQQIATMERSLVAAVQQAVP